MNKNRDAAAKKNRYKRSRGMLLQKRTDTRGVGISSMKKSIYLLTTTPTSHTHTFHPLSTIVIHTFNLCKLKSMDDNSPFRLRAREIQFSYMTSQLIVFVHPQ